MDFNKWIPLDIIAHLGITRSDGRYMLDGAIVTDKQGAKARLAVQVLGAKCIAEFNYVVVSQYSICDTPQIVSFANHDCAMEYAIESTAQLVSMHSIVRDKEDNLLLLSKSSLFNPFQGIIKTEGVKYI